MKCFKTENKMEKRISQSCASQKALNFLSILKTYSGKRAAFLNGILSAKWIYLYNY